MSFKTTDCSIFDVNVQAYVNTINCVGAMGAGIAVEFKKRYPDMFAEYQTKCRAKSIRPGDCYTYRNPDGIYILGLAVKDDWRQWSTIHWIEQSLKSMKLVILENDIKSVAMPLPGGKNGRRGPYGPVPGSTPPPENVEELKSLVETNLSSFAEKFGVDINLCIPSDKPIEKKKDSGLTLENFFTV